MAPDARAASLAHRRLDEIDSLRCIAMAMVLAQHCLFFPFGWAGVWLFFVISGFVVTGSLLAREDEGTPAERLRDFFIRRAARILPVYMLYAGFGALWSAVQTGRFEWQPFLSLIFFYNDFETVFGKAFYDGFPSGHLWTVSIEMQFYLIFGLAFVFMRRRALARMLTGFLVLVPVLRLLAGMLLTGHGLAREDSAFFIYTASFLHFDSFALGALLSLHKERWLVRGMALRLFLAGFGALALYGAGYWAVNGLLLGQTGLDSLRNILSGILLGEHREAFVYTAVALFSAGVVALTASGAAPWSAVTRSPLLQVIGRASYGAYIYHLIWVGFAAALVGGAESQAEQGLAGRLLTFAIAFPLTAAMAHLSFTYVERPVMAAAGQWLKRRKDAPEPKIA